MIYLAEDQNGRRKTLFFTTCSSFVFRAADSSERFLAAGV
jgi:hypothetical protein